MANNEIMIFDGTPTEVLVGATTTIATAVFSVTGTNCTVTEFDNSTDLWPMAVATLKIPDSFAAAPTVGSTIDLYMCRQDLTGTAGDDEVAPTTTLVKGAKYVGSFGPLYAVAEDQPNETVISLAGVRKAKFYIQNNSGATMSFSAGFTVEIEGFTYTPSA
jgi:hypothetical protein